jgi:hypothetical protein
MFELRINNTTALWLTPAPQRLATHYGATCSWKSPEHDLCLAFDELSSARAGNVAWFPISPLLLLPVAGSLDHVARDPGRVAHASQGAG